MGFGLCCDETGIEYAGTEGTLAMLNGLFAQRKNLFRPRFIKMLLDILKFYKLTTADLAADNISDEVTLGEYLTANGFSEWFITHHIVPIGSAIWSTSFTDMYNFPMRFMTEFFLKHGMLSVNERPKWRTISGGTRSYIEPLTASFKQNIRLSSQVQSVQRKDGKVVVCVAGQEQIFDQVVMACHSDQALALLKDASTVEQQVLGSIRYQANDCVLHTDTSVLPKQKRAWTAWNYRIPKDKAGPLKLTYNMNILQNIPCPETLCLTLNNTDAIDPEKILQRFNYSHPQFSIAGAKAQNRWADINGQQNTWFCGAYWGKGFHEDGMVSALRVTQALGIEW